MEHLAGDSILVASPTLRCPFFGHAVLLLIDHGETGSFGLTLNRPLEADAQQVFSELGIDAAADVAKRMRVSVGGPVSRQSGFVLYERSDDEDAGTPVGDSLVLSASADVLGRVARRSATCRAGLFLGYAGWSAGQLEREFREGSWIRTAVSLDLVFDLPPEERWAEAMRRLGIAPGSMVAKVASA